MKMHQHQTSSHFSPPSSMISPGNNNYFTGVDEGGRLSHSPNQLNTHACSHNQCSASFPTLELLEKHEIISHSSGATSVVCTYIEKKKFLLFSHKKNFIIYTKNEKFSIYLHFFFVCILFMAFFLTFF